MTVDELVAELRKHPGDVKVHVHNYEGGIDDLVDIQAVLVYRNVNNSVYVGDHEVSNISVDGRESAHRAVNAGRDPSSREPGLLLS